MVLGALLIHILSAVLGESPTQLFAAIEAAPLPAGGSLVYLSVVASALGFLIYFDLLEQLGPVEINLVSYVAPVFAAAVGFALLSELLDIYTIVGFFIITGGFALIKREAIHEEWQLMLRLRRG
mgnify:FL=1